MAFVANCLLLASCSATHRRYGLTVMPPPADTAACNLRVREIRQLESHVFDTARYRVEGQLEIRYRLYRASESSRSKPLPLVVVFHGSGAVGSDNVSQLGVLAKLFANPGIQREHPAHVLVPQFPTRSSDYAMDTARNVLASTPRPCLEVVLALVDSLCKAMNIDSNRVYAVGFSMGGSTVINALAARPRLFAAGVSVAGIPQFGRREELKAMPIWLIHGTEDTENPISSDERFYQERGGRTRFWKLTATTHDNVLSHLVLGDALPTWLFRQRRR